MKIALLTAIALSISFTQAGATELSAAKKRHYKKPPYHAHQYRPHYRASGAADPSFDRFGRPYQPTVQGPCMIDLGYGRFARCDGSL
jgi:hypothetical protein